MRPFPLPLIALSAALLFDSPSGATAPEFTSRFRACCDRCTTCPRCQQGHGVDGHELFVFDTGSANTIFRMEGDRPIEFAIHVYNETESEGWVHLGVDRAIGSRRPRVASVNWIDPGESAELVATLGRGDEVELTAPLGDGTRAWWSVEALR